MHRVDFAVVGNESVGVSQRPRGEGVGAEAAVHQGESALHALVFQIGEEPGELRRGEHALVDEGAAGERDEVRALFWWQFVLDSLTGDEHDAVQVDACGPAHLRGNEELLEGRHDGSGRRTKAVGADRHGTPPEYLQAFVFEYGLDARDGLFRRTLVGGKEGEADGVTVWGGQFEVDDFSQEAVGHLDQDACAVAGVGLGSGCATVFHVAQRRDTHGDDRTAAQALDVGDKRHAAGVVFETWVVQARWAWLCVLHLGHIR